MGFFFQVSYLNQKHVKQSNTPVSLTYYYNNTLAKSNTDAIS